MKSEEAMWEVIHLLQNALLDFVYLYNNENQPVIPCSSGDFELFFFLLSMSFLLPVQSKVRRLLT